MEPTVKHIELEAVNSLYQEFTQELSKIKEDKYLKRLEEAIRISKHCIKQLREYFHPLQFANEGEEISFFKALKPKFYTHLFYYSNAYRFEIGKPFGNIELQRQYCQSELNVISGDFERNKEFYTYLRSGQSCLDEAYFLRRIQTKPFQNNIYGELDPEFSTGFDLLVAVYWANEKLSNLLNRKINDAGKPLIAFETPTEGPKLSWTDSKTALIELVYAFKAKGSFNNGKATLKDITDFVQFAFGVEINNPTRDFQEILRRKTGYTIYLDGLKDNYLKYIDAIENKDHRK